MNKIFMETEDGGIVEIGEYNKDKKPVFRLAVGAESKEKARKLIGKLLFKTAEFIHTDSIGSGLVMRQINDLCSHFRADITIVEKKS